MASYSFNSEPRVVSTKTNKFNPEDKLTQNIMSDRRIYRGHIHNIHNLRPSLSPQEQEQLHFEEEKEKQQAEMMKLQLENFKQNKIKQTPYDIRPAAPARIEVDLQYFLTDHKAVKAAEVQAEVQTDEFQALPLDEGHIAKKTGLDKYSQIWDGELFDFDEEIQPLLNVLTSKTLEQALLEVEEESELVLMGRVKQEHAAKRQNKDSEWDSEVQKEVKRVQQKALSLQQARAQYSRRSCLINKVQNLSVAKNYLSKLFPKTIAQLYEENVYADTFTQTMHNQLFPELVSRVKVLAAERSELQKFPVQLLEHAANTLRSSRAAKILKHKQKSATAATRQLNFSQSERILRFLYVNEEFDPNSQFKMRLSKKLKGEEYSPPAADRLLLGGAECEEDQSVENAEEEHSQAQEPAELPQFTTISVGEIPSLAFAVANHPFLDTPPDQRKFGFHVELYSAGGELTGSFDASSPGSPGVRVLSRARDRAQQHSTDEKLVLKLRSLPESVQCVLFFVKVNRAGPELKHAQYSLVDHATSQLINRKLIKGEESSGVHLAYRIYRQEQDPRGLQVLNSDSGPTVSYTETPAHWLLDIYNVTIDSSIEEASALMKELILDSADYMATLTSELIECRTRRLLETEEYQRKVTESSARSKKKKRDTTHKGAQPRKMPEYVVQGQGPSRTYGPFAISVPSTSLESLQGQLGEALQGRELYIKHKPLSEIALVLKASTLFHLTIASPPTVAVPESVIEEEGEED